MFTLTQWLQLAATIGIPVGVAYLVTKGTCAMVDRDIRRYRQSEKLVDEIEGTPN
jgi:hypothetical protein